jgi:hypothetical protein
LLVWVGAMAATEALADKNAVFRKLRAKSDNKVLWIRLDFTGDRFDCGFGIDRTFSRSV